MGDEPSWKLQMTLTGPFGERYSMAIGLPADVAREVAKIDPPQSVAGFSLNSFEDTVSILRRKEFRKDLFVAEARRLGTLLAERMEDAEGWHDESRIEPAKHTLRES